MKNKIIQVIFLFLISGGLLFLPVVPSYADWWDRPDARPTQPKLERGTLAPLPTVPSDPVIPTSQAGQPSATPRIGGEPTTTAVPNSTTGNSSSTEDPCAPGKSYVGPYCGWSPRVGGESSGSSGNTQQQKVTNKNRVLGLSYTSGWELLPSDIILLTGVLCLLLYLRSKISVKRII